MKQFHVEKSTNIWNISYICWLLPVVVVAQKSTWCKNNEATPRPSRVRRHKAANIAAPDVFRRQHHYFLFFYHYFRFSTTYTIYTYTLKPISGCVAMTMHLRWNGGFLRWRDPVTKSKGNPETCLDEKQTTYPSSSHWKQKISDFLTPLLYLFLFYRY